jgi:hypothetical protein
MDDEKATTILSRGDKKDALSSLMRKEEGLELGSGATSI